ncbi:PLP-dependent aminotransferase family protein [Bacillus sp. BGMRC 2118]|nr:PLP-dependent aminotransferase family protein [Bacillus sp. BGMRC 2118]
MKTELTIHFTNEKPLYQQLYLHIKNDILQGKREAGEKLPSKRKLSSLLSVSLNTVDAAYQQLLAEGYIESRPRQGLFINEIEPMHPFGELPPSPQQPTTNLTEKLINFSQGEVDIEHFPYKAWRKCSVAALDNPQNLQLGENMGEVVLRNQIADYLYRARGVRCSGEQVIIGAGTQQLLQLLLYLFPRNSTLAMEDPGFYRANLIFKQGGMNVVPIAVRELGIDVEQLENLKQPINLVYCTPSHQFPLGMIMPVQQRQKLIQWAKVHDSYIIEDDYDGEFRYEGKPIPSLQGLDVYERVIYLGTFSKSLIPSARVNYMVLPSHLLVEYKQKLFYMKQTVSKIHQQTISLFIEEGHWDKHVNKMRTLYRKKRETVIESLNRYFDTDKVIIKGEKSGLHVVLELIDTRYTESELIELARKRGIQVYGTELFYEQVEKQNPEILVGYSGLRINEIEQGIKTLSEAWL